MLRCTHVILQDYSDQYDLPEVVTEAVAEEVSTSLQDLSEGDTGDVGGLPDSLEGLSGLEWGLAVAVAVTGLVAACGVAR